MRYRSLKTGEVVESTDEYLSVFAHHDQDFIPVKQCTVGKSILDCNAQYYRRPLKSKEDEGQATLFD